MSFLFYDAPTPPPGIFDGFLAIQPSIFSDIGTRKYLNLIQSAPLNATQGTRYVLTMDLYKLSLVNPAASQICL